MQKETNNNIIIRAEVDKNTFKGLENFNGTVVITDDAYFAPKTVVPCNLIVQGNVHAGDLTIKGNFECSGRLVVSNIDATGNITANCIEGYSVKCKKLRTSCYVDCAEIDCKSGHIHGDLDADKITCPGKLTIEGDLYTVVSDMKVGILQVKGEITHGV